MKIKLRALILCLLIFMLAGNTYANDENYVPASILRGEAPTDCPKCRELTACAIVDDMQKGINLRSRWYGWRNARDVDILLIEEAIEGDMCRKYPACKFVGNGRDLEVWARKGWIADDARSIAYCSSSGCTVCVPFIDSVYGVE